MKRRRAGRKSRSTRKNQRIKGAVLAFALIIAVPAMTLQLREWGFGISLFHTSWIPMDFTYRKGHVIVGSPSGSIENYQIRFVLHRTNGVDCGEHVYLGSKCKADFSDVRFADVNGQLLDYWIEKIEGDYCVVWVKIPYIPQYPNGTKIYLYYGNPNAESLSNENTMPLFLDFSYNPQDDFTSLGGGAFEWDSSEQAWHIAGYAGGRGYYNAKKFDDGYELTVKVKSTGGSVGLFLKFQDSSNYLLFRTDQNNWELVSMINDASSTLASTVYPINLSDYKEWKVRIEPNGRITCFVEGYQLFSSTFSQWTSGYVGFWMDGFYEDNWFDDLMIRRYIEPEPQHGAWGEEEIRDCEPPVITSFNVEPANPSVGSPVTFKLTATDNIGVSSVKLTIQYTSSSGQTFTSLVDMFKADGCWIYNTSFGMCGSVTATAYVFDYLNNSCTKTLSFILGSPKSTVITTEREIISYEVPRGDPIFDILISPIRNVWFWLNDEIVTVRFINKKTCWDEVQVELWLADTSGSPKYCLLKDTLQVGTGTTQVIVPVHVPLMPGDFRLLLKVHEEYSGEEYQLLGTQVPVSYTHLTLPTNREV